MSANYVVNQEILELKGTTHSCSPCKKLVNRNTNIHLQSNFVLKVDSDLSIVINRCHPNPCRNDGFCHDLDDDYRCGCAAGFLGKNCEGRYAVNFAGS